MRDCRIIARLGTGYDNIDAQAAGEAGIPVTNLPEFCTAEVAEHTMALILACSRKLVTLAHQTQHGLWRPDAVMPAHRLSGKTIGLVGFGKIGRAVAERALAFGLRVLFYDPAPAAPASARFKRCATLPELLRQADVISLHLPLSDLTRGVIGREAFRQIKPGAILINCARGAVVVESELTAALRAGRLAAAGLDTLAEEPPAPDNPLLGLRNVVITPHCAAHTVEALKNLRQQAYEEVARALRGEPLLHIVNQKHLKSSAAPVAALTD